MQIDERPLLQVVHSLLRADNSPEEMERAKACHDWVFNNQSKFLLTCDSSEKLLLVALLDSYRKLEYPPTRKTFEIYLKQIEAEKAVLDILERYDVHVDDFKTIYTADIPFYFEERRNAAEISRVLHRLSMATKIATDGHLDKSVIPPRLYKGAEDAKAYLSRELHNGALTPTGQTQEGGALADQRDALFVDFEKRKSLAERGELKIKTGIPCIDEHTDGGLDRGSFYGVIGYAKQGKSTVIRTIAYNAAASGKRVLYIPIETTLDEERDFFYIMHAHAHIARLGECAISVKNWRAGKIDTPTYEKFKEQVSLDFVEDYEETTESGIQVPRKAIGRNLEVHAVPDRSWEYVSNFIKQKHSLSPYDLIVIDYLALCLPSGGKWDERSYVSATIKNVKQLLIELQTATFLTPVQGSRDGWENAAKDGGQWQPSGIYMFSEFEKSLDCLMSIFTNDELRDLNKVKLGIPIARRGDPMAPRDIHRNPACGMLMESATIENVVHGDKNPEQSKDMNSLRSAIGDLNFSDDVEPW